MQSSSLPRSHARAAAALSLCLAAACADTTATVPDAPRVVAALECSVDVRAETARCDPAAGAGGASAAVFGGQGVNVRLRSTGMSYDGISTFRMDVTLENLTGQVLGTWDGLTVWQDGVAMFFASGPTSATGIVEVANATGQRFFTEAAQKYFAYPNLLLPGDTTPPMEWRFTVSPTVETFQFTVLVAAGVPEESGWLRIEPFLPSLSVGESMAMHAYRFDKAGRPAPAEGLRWWSNDPTVARVAADGTVTGVAPGEARIHASSGAPSTLVYVRVFSGAGDVVPPTAQEFTISPFKVMADGLDSVTFSVRLKDGGTGAHSIFVKATPGVTSDTLSCWSFAPAAGTRTDGTFTCRIAVPPNGRRGRWQVRSFSVQDEAQNSRTLLNSNVGWGGLRPEFWVRTPAPGGTVP